MSRSFRHVLWLAATARSAGAWVPDAFPVAFFRFAVPSWAQLGAPLQNLTVSGMGAILRMTGPAAEIHRRSHSHTQRHLRHRAGLQRPAFLDRGPRHGRACTANCGATRGGTRLAQLVVMAVLALLANWVRVYTVIERGYQTDMQTYLVSVSHYWFGWGVFAVALACFFWLTTWFSPQRRWRRTACRSPRPPSPTGPAIRLDSSAQRSSW